MNQEIKTYQNAVDIIKTAILQSQASAVKAVNQEQLALYFGIGRYVSANTRKKNWGQGAIEAISNQLKQELPGLRGFSAPSLRKMRIFYEEWSMLERNSFVPTNKLDSLPEKTFVATNKFTEINTKSSITTDEMGQAIIVHNVKNFIMTFGRGFSFCGSQVHYDKLGHDHWIDLLFFCRDLNRTVVFELKNGNFKVGYLAQLSAYLRILNDDDRRDHEEAPIGIILCKNADKDYAGYIMQDFKQPMGVATYTTADEMDPELLKALPPKEELQRVFVESSKKEDEA